MSSFATTSGSGPFKATLRLDENHYDSIEEFENEEKALAYAEAIFTIIMSDEMLTLAKYGFALDK